MGKKFFVNLSSSDTFRKTSTFVFDDGVPDHFITATGKVTPFDLAIPDPMDPQRFRCRFDGRTITLSEHRHGDSDPSFVYGREDLVPGRGTAVWVAEEGGTLADEVPEP